MKKMQKLSSVLSVLAMFSVGSTYGWAGAGVLPYAQDHSGHAYVLLGEEYNGQWADFGGTIERVKGKLERSQVAAAREGAEETIDLLSQGDLKAAVYNRQGYRSKLIWNQSKHPGYFMYVVPVENKRNIASIFSAKRAKLVNKWRGKKRPKHIHARLEKKRVQWVRVDKLVAAVKHTKNSYNTWVDLVDGTRVQLRPALVGTLRRDANQGNGLHGYEVLINMTFGPRCVHFQ